MTEEIMIDGVDVTGCINFVGCDMCNDFLDGQCEGHNCEYKQLKRLEQENEHYKSALEEIKRIAGNLYYKAIKDPVKREKAIYSIIDKCNEV